MASPQVENGYTRVANEILEQLIKLTLNGTQLRIVLLLWRETYGFSRKECKFSDSYIAARLGIKRQNAHTEFKILESAGIIITTVKPTFSSSRTVSFGKDYDAWTMKSKALQECNNITELQDHAITGMLNHDSGVLQKDSYRKKPLKKNSKKDVDDFFERLWQMYPRKEGKGTVSVTQKAKLYSIGLDEMTRVIERYKGRIFDEGIDMKYVKQGGTFLNSGYVDYLDANFVSDNTIANNFQGVKW